MGHLLGRFTGNPLVRRASWATTMMWVAVLTVFPVHAQTLDGRDLVVKRELRVSSDDGVLSVGRIEDVHESGRAVRTRVVIGPLMEGGVCRQTFYVFGKVMDPSDADVVRMLQERAPLTALAAPRNGACEHARYFTLIGVEAQDGIRLVQSFVQKYGGSSWTPDGAGEVLYQQCLKAGLALELPGVYASTAGPRQSVRSFFSHVAECKRGDMSVGVRFQIDSRGHVSVWMVAVDDRLSNMVVD